MSNILVNRLLPSWIYLPWNMAVAGVIVFVALHVVRPIDCGFGHWANGARWGGVIAFGTLAVLLTAVALPPTHDLFQDDRVDGRAELMLYHALLRIPLGTVLLEEIAFRGALPALFARRFGGARGWLWACVAASVLFGLWHALPSWGLTDVNPVLDDWFGDGLAGKLAATSLAVAGTFAVGMLFCALRFGSGSVAAPMIAHAATNSIAYATAWWVSR